MVNNSGYKYQNIACDGNNLWWRSMTSCAKKANSVDGVFLYTSVITDFLARVKEIQEQFGYKDSKIYFLFDNPKSKISTRQLIDEHYKSHRANESIPKEFWDTLALLEMILHCYSDNYVVMRLDHCEADDLVYPLIMQKIKDNTKTLLISADLDWSRALSLSENVHWFNYHTLYWHKSIFKDEHGFYPEKNKVKFFKTIRGDSSDDIKAGIPNMPLSLVHHIVNTYDDIHIFMNTYNRDDEIPRQWKTKILENRSQIFNNYALVDFVEIKEDIESYSFYCKENIGELRYWFNLLDLPLEHRMIDKSEGKKAFLQKAKLKRIKRFTLD